MSDRPPASWRAAAPWAAAAAAVALLPFARGLLGGQAFYFRDLSRQFFPLRRFVTEGLRAGELRHWNPLVHEGEPISSLPLSYPLDLLQVLISGEAGLSLLLALHVPLAAVAFFALARGLGLAPVAAAGGGVAYALGGFSLSSLNLYVHVQAVAWAPLVALGVIRGATGGPRAWALGALALAVALSTTGVEIVAQAVLLGLALAASRDAGRWVRMALVVALGAGLAGVTLALLSGLVAASARATGFSTRVVLGFDVHPVTFLQVVVSALHGNPANLVDEFWGAGFFEAFPYFLSFYLGPLVLCLAVLGGRAPRGAPLRLLLLALAGALVCLGRRAGLEAVVDALPLLKTFRYPSKAFFTVHMALTLLAAYGLDALQGEAARRGARRLMRVALGVGGLLAAAPLLPALAPALTLRVLRDFFVPGLPDAMRVGIAAFVARDAATGGLVALAAAGAAWLALRGRLRPGAVALSVAALAAADLVRAGAGLNPTVRPSFYELSPEVAHVTQRIEKEGGRLFTCDPELGTEYWRLRRERRQSELWTMALLMETLTPFHNMRPGVLTAYSRDLTMLVPEERVLTAAEAGCADFGALADRLRRAGVAHVVSLAPLPHPDLALQEVAEARRLRPAVLHVYSLRAPLPLRAVASSVTPAASPEEARDLAGAAGFQAGGGVAVEGATGRTEGALGRIVSLTETPTRIEIGVEVDRPTVVVVRDAFAPGWSATVEGEAAPLLRADGRHRAVPVPAGRSRVVLRYRPPGFVRGFALTAASALAFVALMAWPGAPRKAGS